MMIAGAQIENVTVDDAKKMLLEAITETKNG